MTIADQRVLVGASASLQSAIRDSDGDLVAAVGTVTVGVTTADGTEVLAAGTATTSPSTGIYAVAIDPPTQVDIYVATWTDDGTGISRTTYHEVVGGFYASLAEIRASDGVFQDTTRYPDADVIEARRLVETEFEQITDRAFVPRSRRVHINNRHASSELVLPDPDLRSIRSVREYNGSSYTSITVSGVMADPAGIARVPGNTSETAWPAADLVVEYEHGSERPPSDVLGAFYTRVRDVLNRPNRGVPDRTSSFTSADNGTFSLIVPGQAGFVTGIPDVDVVLERYSGFDVGVA